MRRFQILCTTMGQSDFSKLHEMNIHSDVIFTNQAGETLNADFEFEGHCARMITTDTRGVGINRNLGLMYADAEICLFADDDVRYDSEMEERVLKEFAAHPDADLIIFNLDSGDSSRKQKVNIKTRKCNIFSRMPYGACRIAFRLSSIRKANIWFTTLFGGGCKYPSGEDSMWLEDARKKHLTVYTSKEFLGTVSFEESSWFTGRDEKYFYGRGAYYQAVHPRTLYLWILYFAFRIRDNCQLTFLQKIKWMVNGAKSYQQDIGVADIQKHIK